MTPSQLSAQLRHIAAKISNSKSPRRDLVAADLKTLIRKISSDDRLPNREPDEIWTNPKNPEHTTKIWFLDNNGKSQVHEDITGIKEWYLDGKIHRDDGPAAISPTGVRRWFKHGLLHREDGPAVERLDGNKSAYYINGIEVDINDPNLKQDYPKLYDYLVVNGVMNS